MINWSFIFPMIKTWMITHIWTLLAQVNLICSRSICRLYNRPKYKRQMTLDHLYIYFPCIYILHISFILPLYIEIPTTKFSHCMNIPTFDVQMCYDDPKDLPDWVWCTIVEIWSTFSPSEFFYGDLLRNHDQIMTKIMTF